MKNTVPIKRNTEFLRLYKKGKFYAGRNIVLYVMKNRFGINRLGITVGKKFGKSVKRNRIKRHIRESYRFYEEFIKNGYDLVFVARSSEQMPAFLDIKKEMKFLLKKLEVFEQEKWCCLKDG
ncbi:ribonuclease P protein component [Acetivibrio mesophilus]|uniref:Ribonuclease P protein component n=1 Tax=Acetivibrio mesophilus TaxID=2487273 RepID=A0A4V1K1S5_9FIRM|nr:ribonuclease P protein component [Acetivibrio mesophilus]RXE57809.1 ribonuclease P protein component [Acetivibrio mesophilus]